MDSFLLKNYFILPFLTNLIIFLTLQNDCPSFTSNFNTFIDHIVCKLKAINIDDKKNMIKNLDFQTF